MLFRKAALLFSCLLVLPLFKALASDRTPVFDKSEIDELMDKLEAEEKHKLEKAKQKEIVLIAYHTKLLKSKDYEERAVSAEYLGVLNAAIAVPDLIDCLRPSRQEKDIVMRSAHGALNKITGKNFDIKAYDEWVSWWQKNKTEFPAPK
jgi:hypothetical protein